MDLRRSALVQDLSSLISPQTVALGFWALGQQGTDTFPSDIGEQIVLSNFTIQPMIAALYPWSSISLVIYILGHLYPWSSIFLVIYILDHYGAIALAKYAASPTRLTGAVLVVLGVSLVAYVKR